MNRSDLQALTLVVAGLVLVFALIGVLVARSERAATERALAAEAAERAAVAQQRADDSMLVVTAITNPADISPDEVYEAKRLMGIRSFSLPHPELHSRYIDLQLDSVEELLTPRPEGWGDFIRGGSILESLSDMNSAQQRRHDTLKRRRDAQAKLQTEEARRQSRQAAAEAERQLAASRRNYARVVENIFLDQGMDVTVTVSGSQATTLRLEHVLFSRVWSHQFQQQNEVWSMFRSLGFKRIEMTDGYDFSVYWRL